MMMDENTDDTRDDEEEEDEEEYEEDQYDVSYNFVRLCIHCNLEHF